MVVGRGEYIEPLKNVLVLENEKEYKNTLRFCFCEDVEEVLSSSENVNPDYISYVVDPTNKSSIKMVGFNTLVSYLTSSNLHRVC